jgi:hypothetical protein
LGILVELKYVKKKKKKKKRDLIETVFRYVCTLELIAGAFLIRVSLQAINNNKCGRSQYKQEVDLILSGK